jgi:threonine dehydrogenase-like Zn-dependent dehydrogenase
LRAARLRGAGDIAVEEIDDPRPQLPGDAVVRVVAAGICGTDLRGFAGLPGPANGPDCGHEFVGVVAEVGAGVARLRVGDLVVAPFTYSDGVCAPCVRGFPGSCRSGGMFGVHAGGGQAEAVRVPFADSTLIPVPMAEDDERIPAVLALADVLPTGVHAVASSRIAPGSAVAVIGDGPVGLCSVLAARRAGAERVLLLGRHESRLEIGKAFGACDLVTARGAEAAAAVLEATAGAGADLVVDAVGDQSAADVALSLCADGGTVARIGGPDSTPDPLTVFLRNITVAAGLAPARRYLPELLAEVLDGTLDASPVFDHQMPLERIGDGYRAMAGRTATKVLVRP